ncbi:hypothetical protein CBS115989_5809 [Aspergillus niger]|nr:hypothetical protein CBS115989_5809 [Aspergillus niger]
MGSACQANDQSISGEENPGRAGINVRNPPKILGKYVGSLASPNYTATHAEHVEDIIKDSALVAYNTDKHLAMSGSVALSGVPCHGDAGRYPFGPDVLRTCTDWGMVSGAENIFTARQNRLERPPSLLQANIEIRHETFPVTTDTDDCNKLISNAKRLTAHTNSTRYFLQEARDWLAVNLIRSTF